MPGMRFLIITGLSGAGKSATMHVLEDTGYFCVDNLPPALIPKFAELCVQSGGTIRQIAVVCDIRGGEFFSSLFNALAQLEAMGFSYEILFLEASDEVLVRRFKESRRRHPLGEEMGILEGIAQERARLSELRGSAHHVIDTSRLTLRELWNEITTLFGAETRRKMVVHVTSFGFKRGVPLDADFVLDVRFLPNPYYVDALRPIDGTHPAVKEYVFKWPVTQRYVEKLVDFFDFQLPHMESEGRSLVNIAIGCTGGQHRSVALVEHLSEHIRSIGYPVRTVHRDSVPVTASHPGSTS